MTVTPGMAWMAGMTGMEIVNVIEFEKYIQDLEPFQLFKNIIYYYYYYQ
jgi:hypothetical protein